MGVHGNEEADRLAKTAALDLLPRRCQLLFSDFFPAIRTAMRNLWQDQWNRLGENKMKEITDIVYPWKYENMPRRWETALCRLRIGHTRLTHSFLMVGGNQPLCEACRVPLTVRHLLVECPSLGNLRTRLLVDAKNEDGTFSIAKVLGKEVEFDVSGIFRFIAEAGLLHKL